MVYERFGDTVAGTIMVDGSFGDTVARTIMADESPNDGYKKQRA